MAQSTVVWYAIGVAVLIFILVAVFVALDIDPDEGIIPLQAPLPQPITQETNSSG